MVATGQSQIFTNSLPILLNCLSLNTYTLSALLFLMGKGRPGVPARTKGSVIGTGLPKGHEAKGNWNLTMNADRSGHWNTVSESNNHTWSKKLPGGGGFKGTDSFTHRTKKDSLKQWWAERRMPLYSYCCSELQQLYRSQHNHRLKIQMLSN